jgi:plastocyanin
MKFRLGFHLLTLLLFMSPSLYAQDTTGVFKGRVSLPIIKKENRTYRGRMYRNRLAARKKENKEHKSLKSPLIDIIIVLHPLNFKADSKPLEGVKIIQKNAEFIPRVIPVTRNTVVQFVNYDNFYHNVFSVTPGARFNLGRRPTRTVVEHKIERPGEIEIFCDIHAQMNATILSLDTPFFSRVNPNGMFRIENLPEGEYLVQVYHPDLPEMEEHIFILAGETISKSFSLSR